jgi:hypothetical protein
MGMIARRIRSPFPEPPDILPKQVKKAVASDLEYRGRGLHAKGVASRRS